jgi:hypothetical protein
MHFFGRDLDHDCWFELPRQQERDAQSIARCSTAHHGDFRAVPRADRIFSPARGPIPRDGGTLLLKTGFGAEHR